MNRTICGALAALSMLAAGAFAAPQAHAQAWPSKPVRVIVNVAAGGIADRVARLLGPELSQAFGQPVVVENRGGAGGNIAAQLVSKAAPDGYAVLVTTSAIAVNQSLTKNPGYDAEKDLVAAALVASSPNVIVAAPTLGANTLQEVVEKAKSGKLNYGTAGPGTTPHLSAEYLFKILAKVPVTHVPYKGGGPALAALMASEIELVSVAMPPAVPMIKSGKIRGIAVTSDRRVAALPDVPTVAESGFPGFADYTWVGLFVPAGTPADAVARLNGEIDKLLQQPDLRERLATIGFEPIGGTPAQFADYLKTELVKWAKVVRETGASAE
jgi:tripartite-type tricarboxylate transporter receptor subunit TctC